jgi:alkaline phosphatase
MEKNTMSRVLKNIFQIIITGMLIFQLISCQTGSAKPKNIIVFISDGCGFNQVDAASLYQYGQTGKQIYEQFPVKYAMSTFPVNGHGYDPKLAWKDFEYVLKKTTDSAASATAMATGIKTTNGSIGVKSDGKAVINIIERVEKLGKVTGVVSSVLFSHATPTSFVVHNESRSNYEQLAAVMIRDSKLEVIMGCGHPFFNDDGQPRSEKNYKFVGGEDVWKSLMEGTIANDSDGDGTPDPWVLIQDLSEFQSLMTGPTDKRIIGIPKVGSTLQVARSGDEETGPFSVPFTENVPTLREMTKVAINVLDEDPDGFFLMAEGGAVDWASHGNHSGRMIEEEIDFNKAVETAVEWVEKNSSWDETLIIVTGDHETGYLTGPGSNPESQESGSSVQDIWKPLINNGAGKLPGMEWHTHGHSNSLIPFYAKGFGSEKFHQRIKGTDPVRGKYIDNADIGQVLLSLYPGK